jgi:hypothetical protein
LVHITFHVEVFIAVIHSCPGSFFFITGVDWCSACPSIMASKRKASLVTSNECPNPLCKRQFQGKKHLQIHLSKTKVCTDAIFKTNKEDANELSDSRLEVDAPDLSDSGFEADEDDDDKSIPWACVAWDTSSEEELSEDESSNSVATSKSLDDAEEDDNANDSVATSSELFTSHGLCFTPSDYAETKLLKILNDAHAPHFLYPDLLNWAKEAKRLKYDFKPRRTTRPAQIKHIEKLAQLHHCRAQTIQLTLPGDDKVIPVTRFPFVNMLYSLLSDQNLVSDLSKLDVNPDNPFGKYKSEGDRLSTVNSGAWYQQAYKHCVKDPEKDFVVPIVMTCDETKLKGKGKTGVCPLSFTTSIFNQELRNKSEAWRPLGYIYDLAILESQEIRAHQKPEYKGKRLHAIFAAVLQSLIDAQKSGILDNVTITLGGHKRVVNLRVPVIFIIGDMQGGDKMCCSSAGYSNKMKRLCRKCNVRGSDSGDPFVKCRRMSMVKIKELVESNNVAALKAISQHNVYSAWFDVGYGGCRYGIFSAACPVEALHAFENGLIPDALHILFDEEMYPAQLRELDRLVIEISRGARQKYFTSGSNPEMPRLRWLDGITNLSDLEAKYKVGIMLTVVIITLTDDGFALFTRVFGSAARVAQMRQVFQMMLCYWMWLKKDKYWKRGDKVAKLVARTAIQTMLSELMKLWPREKGQGWQKAKVHEQLHVPDDIERNGAPAGWHSGPTENNHIATVKNFASQTNRRRETLDEQIGNRNAESFIINSAFQTMTAALLAKQKADIVNHDDGAGKIARTASKALLYVYKDNRVVTLSLPQWSGADNGNIQPCLALFLQDHFGRLPALAVFDHNRRLAHARVELATEYTRGGEMFRSNPNYRQGGPWLDWTMFRWAKEGTKSKNKSKEESNVHYGDDEDIKDNYTYAPGMILGFISTPQATSFASPGVDNTQVVVMCCDSEYRKSSVFSTYWKVVYTDKAMTKPMIRLVSPEAIVRHCCMIPENKEWNGFHEIWTRERWGEEFCDV